MRSPRRKYPLCIDAWGDRWDVREARATAHGWDVLIGWPEGCRGRGHAGPQVIPTRDLIGFWEARRLDRDGAIYDLPIARTTVKRLRRVLGLNYYADAEQWWIDRLQDLAAMPGTQFATTHGLSEAEVSRWHTRLFGRRTRDAGWWQDPKVSKILIEQPRTVAAVKLGISAGAAGRLKWVLKKGAQ